MQQPWETGWRRADGPAPQAEMVATKVHNDATYHLWKSPDGAERIQKNSEYFEVSPGAFNTIPTQERLGASPRIAGPKDQT